MKIGIITYTLSAGGVSTFVLSLGKFFKSNNYDVEVITEQHKGVWYNKGEEYGLKVSSKNLSVFSWLPFGKLIHAYRISNFIRKKAFDVIILNNCIYSQLAAHRLRAKVIISVIHNDSKGVYQVASKNVSNIDIVSCVSLATYKGAETYIEKSKLVFIPNGIKLAASPINSFRKFTLPLKIVFVGGLENERKGIFFIPDILEKLKSRISFDFHLTIVGDGSDRKNLEERIKSKKLEKHVTFTGVIDNKSVYDLYLSHHIFLMTSFYEGLPLTMIEAMACGCVPVVSYLKDITDYCITDGKEGFLISIKDIDKFSDKIAFLANHFDTLKEMSNSAHERAVNKFSLQRMGIDYLTTIEEHLKSPLTRKFNIKNYTWKDLFPEKVIVIKHFINHLIQQVTKKRYYRTS